MRHRVSIQDLAFLGAGVLCAGFLALEYDVFREDGTAPSREQRIELNEVLSLGAFLILGLLIFAWRRLREFKDELARRVAAERSAHLAARHDSLTGLANRRCFDERVTEALGKALGQGSRCAVLFIDLDGFKPVNDTLGHHAGDALLIAVADRLRRLARQPENVARLGGDEFAVLVEWPSGDDAPVLVARQILKEIRRPILVDGTSIEVGATVGVALGPNVGRRADDLIRAADFAMYEGKREGRGTVKVFEAA